MPFFCETLKCCWEERHFLHPACLQALGWSSLAAASLTAMLGLGYLQGCPVPLAPTSEDDPSAFVSAGAST